MNELTQTKVCPLCAETIKATAKICPHCRYAQHRWSLTNPQVTSVLGLILFIGLMGGMGAFYGRMFGPKEQFADYRDQISVVSSQVSFRMVSSNLTVSVVGMLTNHSHIGWKNVGVEAQFFNKDGRLIDAISASVNDYRDGVILPHGEAAFKIETRAAQPQSDYDTCKSTVRWAKDVATVF